MPSDGNIWWSARLAIAEFQLFITVVDLLLPPGVCTRWSTSYFVFIIPHIANYVYMFCFGTVYRFVEGYRHIAEYGVHPGTDF